MMPTYTYIKRAHEKPIMPPVTGIPVGGLLTFTLDVKKGRMRRRTHSSRIG